MNRISDILRQRAGQSGFQTFLHLVGIRYHQEIGYMTRQDRLEMLRKAGLNSNFETELMKGVKLGQHVKIRPESEFANFLDLENQAE